ncbi:MAG: NHL repeat-containing protein [Candidatus Aminicenantes bacterium]|nr:NHL repeat-containing protein [Candidatus Aminicenantes bacterium]
MRKKALASARFAIFIFSLSCCLSIVTADTEADIQAGVQSLSYPVRIAFDPDKNLVVSDSRQKKVFVLDRDTLEITRGFPVDGRPLAVGCVSNRIIVGNETRNRVEVYKGNGRLLYYFDTPVQRPMDMAVDINRNCIFVVDGGQKAVIVFDLQGNLLLTIPGAPPDTGILTNPTAIAIDSVRKRVYVSDYGDQANRIYPRIQIFRYSGRHVSTIAGKIGMFGSRFSRPQGLAVTGKGQVLMLDCFSAEIMMFDEASGALLKTFGEYGTAPGQMRLPLDMVYDPGSKRVFVTNNGAGRIEVLTK